MQGSTREGSGIKQEANHQQGEQMHKNALRMINKVNSG